MESKETVLRYKHALVFWNPYGALSDSIMIECFTDFDALQAREQVIRDSGYQTIVESDFNLLEYMEGLNGNQSRN